MQSSFAAFYVPARGEDNARGKPYYTHDFFCRAEFNYSALIIYYPFYNLRGGVAAKRRSERKRAKLYNYGLLESACRLSIATR